MSLLTTSIGRPRVMGILNVTPDSFSDGGRWATTDAAIAQGLRLVQEGADVVDVGGESTRPGATRPPAADELARVLPVISTLAQEGVPISIDTMRADVARAAVDAGAVMINDVSGGLADPIMVSVAAELAVDFVAMHWRAPSDTMQDFASYDAPGGVVTAVAAELRQRVESLIAAGVDPSRLVLDPGLGFAKTAAHNWALIRALPVLQGLGFPLLVGSSRKAFLGGLLADASGAPRTVDQRESANTALTVMLAQRQVWGVRVHDVQASYDALKVWERVEAPKVEER